MSDGLVIGADGITRCWWPGPDPVYVAYHDLEWGQPVHDDHRLFEKICLEGFQSGLSWLTILRKRDNFRRAFAHFDPQVVAGFGPPDVDRLLADAGIVRHRGKIEATINNAGRALEVIDAFGSLDHYVWQWQPDVNPTRNGPADIPATSEEATAMARDLKKRGWRFVGPTTAYAFFQAMGLVNDHVEGCEFA
jgi:DNA-3-methyladenine glycosylase I